MTTRILTRLRQRIRTAGYLRKWVVLGALIGLISGLGAALFFEALELATRAFLGVLAGFTPATPAGEGAAPITDALRPWALPIVVALGGLISGIIVFRFAPEAEGHGTDAAIAAFHHGPKQVRGRIPLIKLVASAITIGSGGSGGREGPTAQIGAGFGSYLARLLDLDARDARIAVSTGIGAGIGAIFRAPLGGAVLAAEIPYREDVESDALVPAFVAAIIAYSVFGAFVGFDPIFGSVAGAGFQDPRQLLYYALIGVLAGVVGRLYIAGFYGASRWFGSWRVPRMVRPAIAGFAVGCIGLALPGALGTGYGWVQAGLDRQTLLGLPLWIVLVLPFAKIVATSLSIGSGGSGGIFGPGMVIGGLLGAGVWRLLEPVAPAVPVDPSPFVIVAMMALFGSIAHAPLAVMLMVAEMTDNLAMLGPAMLAVGLATLVVGDRSIYASQLRSRADSAAHRLRFAMPLLASMTASDAARTPRVVLAAGDGIGAALARLQAADVPGAPVVGPGGGVLGSFDADTAAALPADRSVTDAPLDPTTISADDPLDTALGALADRHRSWAPVTAAGRLTGVLSARDALSAYRGALAANIRRMEPVTRGGTLLVADIAAGSSLDGTTVAAAGWPAGSLLVTVARGDAVLVARGDVALRAGDRLTVFATDDARAAVQALLAGRPADDGRDVGALPAVESIGAPTRVG